ncbi:hypothetical protein SPRG_02564 [Saprolegnia parasitica CBS 223.65]|uniref:Molybdenum cofactor sulfurase n=1 Tax=Saprolegnia parasitica (strain CBS 223.65) TaxID=695850 RepID=A0A067D1G3_SAPPC|nr:hypothetical protein SPRG_02564 [Saprolegnia parasitica CBS 223.65]KDO32872.1 hypothetical protein SPRG_02564 [Saprolegnia parasitica CBS 223.65]|eukprot:XP_012196523.1 hypothetical protein SPRG_02564 [Saprolegnia parasitica CBS 223.65]
MDTGYGYGKDEEGGDVLTKMREDEFPHMQGHVYLDHAGATMFSAHQLRDHQQLLVTNLYGNPHSTSAPSGSASAAAVDDLRAHLAAFFKTSLETYDIVFTSGATAGLKLVGEAFQFTSQSAFVYSTDSHNSVLGIRAFAQAAGAAVVALPTTALDALASPALDETSVLSCNKDDDDDDEPVWHLCAFPGECNFSGAKHPLHLVSTIQANGFDALDLARYAIAASSCQPAPRGRWLVLLDAAKLAATGPVDLSTHTPDFMVLSFYKLFGYPTGLGVLFIKRSSQHALSKRYFGGGTLATSLASSLLSTPRPEMHRQFADGTPSFLSLLACRFGFAQLEKLGMDAIGRHVSALTAYLVRALTSLRHGNDRAVCVIYGDHHHRPDLDHGSIVACNFLRHDGSAVGYSEVSALASLHQIHLRTGCFCNPGACQKHLGLSANALQTHIELGHTCGDAMDVIDGQPTGAVRVSVGYMTTQDDVDTFLSFVSTYFVSATLPVVRHAPPATPLGVYVAAITLFPIKSCAGLSVASWPLGPRGLLYDREWAIVDPVSGKALRQKDTARLTQIRPKIDLVTSELVLRCGALAPLRLPLTYAPSTLQVPRAIRLTVCATACDGSLYDSLVASWCTKALDRPCTLARVAPTATTAIGFANEAPYLLLSRGSVADMNGRMKTPVSEAVFRANIVIDGCGPYEEDAWKGVRVGETRFDVLGPCSRCSMINIDPTTGAFSPAPLQTLASYRRERAKIFFGQFLRQQSTAAAILTVGDPVVGER